MKIGICGEYYSTNLGDPIIVDSVRYMTEVIYKEAAIKIIDLDGRVCRNSCSVKNKKNRKNYNVKLKEIKTFIKWKLKDEKKLKRYFNRALDDVDLLIIAGGQLIMNNNLMFPLRLHMITKIADEKKIPIIFNSCGVQSYNNENFGTKLLKKSLNYKSVKIVTTRDDLKMLEKYVSNKKIIVGKNIDGAVWCDKAYNIEKRNNNNTIGLGIIAPEMYKVYYERTNDKKYYISKEKLKEFWVELIINLNKENIKWKIFCNGAKADYEFGCEIIETMGYDRDEKRILDRPLEPKKLVEDISKFEFIISQRLHSHIIATAFDIPTIGLVWDEKVLEYGKLVGREKYFFSIADTKIETIIKTYKDYKCLEKIETNTSDLKKSAMVYIEKMKKILDDRDMENGKL